MKNEGGDTHAASGLSEQQRKKKYFEESRQFEHKAVAVEKECNGVIFSKRSEFRRDFLSLEDANEQYRRSEKAEILKLKQQLTRIKSNVEKLQHSLTDVKPSAKFVEKLKEIMEDIENSIMNFKKEQREKFEDLLREERVIMQELTASEKKFESWSRLPAAAVESTKAVRKATRQSSSMPPAIAAFERFLAQTGGHQGGWDDYDHQEYLRMKQQNKTKDKDAFIHSALSNLPGRSYDDVRQHDDWYSEYLILLDKKKKAIQEWKHHKDTEKMDKLSNVDEHEKSDLKEKRKAELYEKERQERLAKLDEWKVQREIERTKQEEEKVRMEVEAMKNKQKEDKRKREIKSQVEEFARHREEEKEILRMTEEQRRKMERENRKLSASDIARLKERNEKLAMERKTKIESKEIEREEKERRLEKLRSQVEVHAKRDPSRLLKLTEGLKERKKATPQPGSGAPGIHMPHRAVPTWRQGMS
ncbi:coiled-coil domain-containing protein 112-like [Dendronephthya gigantea]|uniref:coiled-coil domain-containing protein 112-like n=1 Tax=Dendronephthya gigantea TaxID=151771 RepID=UPI00106907B6|nr:coiled-coil domain-containing protein 112-like [Dendronephthya gigantea]